MKKCRVYYHQISKYLFHRVCEWPDGAITTDRVKIITDKHGDEIEILMKRGKSK